MFRINRLNNIRTLSRYYLVPVFELVILCGYLCNIFVEYLCLTGKNVCFSLKRYTIFTYILPEQKASGYG